jgi:hypothetical protein
MWNAVIAKVRHEQLRFSASIIQRLNAHNKNVGDIELLIVVLWRRHWDN